MRLDYGPGGFDIGNLAPTWHEQLQRWLAEAKAAGVVEPNAMVLATVDADGAPSTRTLLCKGLDDRGLVFFTNYSSAKSRALEATRRAAATFPWLLQFRQVNVRGRVEKVDRPENLAYWITRPRGSQLGAWASRQSTPVPDRAALDQALKQVGERFAHASEVPLPQDWGGWRLVPDRVEFWQGRSDRLHDRLRFDFDGARRAWQVSRLAP